MLPTVLTIGGWLALSQSPASTGHLHSVEIAPFQVLLAQTEGWTIPIKLLASMLFPLAVYGLHFPAARSVASLNLAWLTFGVAFAYAALLAERGEQMKYGNFCWSAQLALLILFVESVVFLMGQVGHRGRWYVCGALLAGHVAAGIAYYTHVLTSGRFH